MTDKLPLLSGKDVVKALGSPEKIEREPGGITLVMSEKIFSVMKMTI